MNKNLILPSGRTLSDVVTGVTVNDRTTERSDAVFMAKLLREAQEQGEEYKPRSAQEIVDQTLEVSRIIYRHRGYVVPEGFKFYESKHPHEIQAWSAACEIQEILTNTDPEDALCELEDESEANPS